MSVSRVALHPQGPTFSRLIMGYWRLMEWQLSPAALLDLMKYHLDLGVTTIDHADIYGGYQCEEAFGHALRLECAVEHAMTEFDRILVLQVFQVVADGYARARGFRRSAPARAPSATGSAARTASG